MAKTIAQLRNEAQTIKNETTIGANTATRVGGFGEDIVDYLEDNQSSGGSFATGEAVGNVSLFDEMSDLDGKLEAEKALMLPNGKMIDAALSTGKSSDFTMSGNNSTAVIDEFTLTEGHRYYIRISPTNYAVTNISANINIYSLHYYVGSAETAVFVTLKGQSVQEYHYFTAAAADKYRVTIRADVGQVVTITVCDLDGGGVVDVIKKGSNQLITSGAVYDAVNKIMPISKGEYHSIVNGTTRRHICYAIPKGRIRVVLSGSVSGYRSALKQANAITTSTFSSGPVYSDTGWITNGYADMTFDVRCNYVVLSVSKTNNAAISEAEALNYLNNISLTFYYSDDAPTTSVTNATRVKMGAHRGLWYFGLPENSIPAWELACNMGYDYIECDVRVTSDGGFVIMHDASINRTCKTSSYGTISGTVNVADKTLSELRSGYLLASDDPSYRTPIPTLDEYLFAVKDSRSTALIELEPMTNVQVQAVYDRCVEVLGKGRFAMNSAEYGELDYVRSIDQDIDLFYEKNGILNTTSTIDGLSRNHPHNVWFASYDGTYGALTAAVVANYHAAGMRVGAWTVPSDRYAPLREIGVDMVMTNDTAPMLSDASMVRNIFDFLHQEKTFFATDGTIGTTGIALTSGQYVDFKSVSHDKGLIVLRITATGNYTITLNAQTCKNSPNPTFAAFSEAFNDATIKMHEIKALYRQYIYITGGTAMMPFVRLSATGATTIHAIELAEMEVK